MASISELMFPGLDPLAAVTRLEQYKAELNKSADTRNQRGGKGQVYDYSNAVWSEATGDTAASALATLSKSLSPDQMTSIQAELAKAGQIGADITKDISLTSPLSTGLVPYDLEAPAKLLFPVLSPVRNGTARVKGQGITRRIKQITGISNSGTGGVARLSPFMADSTTDAFAGLTLQRPKKISYAGADVTFNYKQMGLSDSVTWSAEFAGQGFQDPRQLSQTSVLMASMLADELAIIGGRGTDAGVYLGAPAAPTFANFAVTVRTAGAGETGNTANIANVYLKVTAEGIFGESAASTTAANTGLSAATGKVLDITITAGAIPAGTTGLVYYLSIDNTTWYRYGRSAIWGGTSALGSAAFTFNFTGGGTGGAIITGATAPAADTTSSANAYDGLLTVQLDPARSGAIYNMSPIGSAATAFSTSNPGVEFQNLFAALYLGGVANVTGATAGGSGVKANPDTIWMHGMDRKQLSDTIKTGASTNPAFIMTSGQGQDAIKLGGMVSAIYNEITGKLLNINVHPYFNQGTALVMSEQLEIPNSQVSDTYYYALPQDYMAINWPVIATTYDVSSWWFGALIHAAPMFSGALTGIKQV